MKIQHTITIAAAALAMLAAGCKTTEQNYRNAYQRAIEDKDGASPVDNTIYAAIRNEALPSAAITADGDTLRFKYERIRVTDGQGEPSQMHVYNVVAGQFKQSFNARALAGRLRDMGYDGTFIAQTAEPLYYVIIHSTNDAASARKALDALRANTDYRPLDPAPFVVAATR